MGLLEQAGNGQAPMDQGAQAQGGQAQKKPMNMKPEVSPQAKEFYSKAVQTLYKDNFENMIDMFQKSGPEGFPMAISAAVNSTLEKIKREGDAPKEVKGEVGIAIFMMLAEDLETGGVLEITPEMMQQGLQQTIKDYSMKNPGDFNGEEYESLVQQELAAQGGQMNG